MAYSPSPVPADAPESLAAWLDEQFRLVSHQLAVISKLQLTSQNKFKIVGSLDAYADDSAAASGGVPINGLYRTGSVIKIRVS